MFERPSDEVIRELSRALRQALGVSLFGIDIIINNQTGQHAVIDVNAFPGEQQGKVTLRWRSPGYLMSSGGGKRVSLTRDGRAHLILQSRASATLPQSRLLRCRDQ